MSEYNKNIKNINELPEELDSLFRKLKVPSSSVSKDEAWNKLLNEIKYVNEQPSINSRSTYVLRYAIAAAILVLFVLSWSYLKYSTTTVICPSGKQITIILPDHSKITLNAQTYIKYPKYFIFNSRNVLLEGEAIFHVIKGDNFRVYDNNGNKVEVLGTQFNVSTRNNQFKVQCFEGKVKVSSYKGKSLNISKGFEAEIQPDSIKIEPLPSVISEGPTWIKGEFFFQSSNLVDVFEELQRQYNIKIITSDFDPSTRTYTGVFYKNNLEEALKMVVIPMNLKYDIVSDSIVRIKPN